MWVYEETGKDGYLDGGQVWTVGFYDPDGEWHGDSDHSNKEIAAKRCHWLNGGNLPGNWTVVSEMPKYEG